MTNEALEDDVDSNTQDTEEVRRLTKEFVERLKNVDNEIDTLKEDRKALVSEYKKKLDLKTLNAAIKVSKIQSQLLHKDAFDTFMEVLADEGI